MTAGNDIDRIVGYFEGRPEVSALYIFGSFGKGAATRGSDIDIAVLVGLEGLEGRAYGSLQEEYYEASRGFSAKSVDIIILNTASSFLRDQILKTGKVLLDRGIRREVAGPSVSG